MFDSRPQMIFSIRSSGRLKLLVLILVVLAQEVTSQASTFRVGAASASITPDQPCYLAGYGGAGLSVGVHDSLFVKAVIISESNHTAALVTLDCIGLLHTELLAIRKKVSEFLRPEQFNPKNIILSSTHTHLGPDVVGLWGKHIFSSGVQSEYMDFLINRVAQTIVAAWNQQVPARVCWSTGSYGEGWVQNISVPEELDRSVTSVQFADELGNSIATLTNFACHPTLIGAERKLISADYVAGFYNCLDQEYGGVNLFLQGSIGGWVQPVGEDSFENADAKGQGLASEVIRILKTSTAVTTAPVIFESRMFDMPVHSFGFKLLSTLGVLKRDIGRTVQTEVAWLRVGNIHFITHPGETSPYYGMETKKLFPQGDPVLVLGLAQDALGYLVRPEFFDEQQQIPHADYLTKVSVGKDGGPVMMREIQRLVQQRFAERK